MGELKLFTPDEIAQRTKPKRQQHREARERQISAYAEALAPARSGFAGELVLNDGEEKKKVRALLKEAAQRNNQQLRFRPIKDAARIEFSVVAPEKKAKTTARGGRPKKSS